MAQPLHFGVLVESSFQALQNSSMERHIALVVRLLRLKKTSAAVGVEPPPPKPSARLSVRDKAKQAREAAMKQLDSIEKKDLEKVERRKVEAEKRESRKGQPAPNGVKPSVQNSAELSAQNPAELSAQNSAELSAQNSAEFSAKSDPTASQREEAAYQLSRMGIGVAALPAASVAAPSKLPPLTTTPAEAQRLNTSGGLVAQLIAPI